MKAIVVDTSKCNGCFNCQIACKDEHCENDWTPISKPQPLTGHFWCRVEQEERGRVPVVRVQYTPRFCDHDAELLRMAPECVYRRDDGIVIIDPEKAVGRKDLADAFDDVYWNEEFEVPQKCTMCAHLLDNGWAEPRCVDLCATGALRFGDIEDFADELSDGQLQSAREEGIARAFYLNVPKRWIAGTVADRSINEVIIGATVTISDETGVVAQVETDEFGDFRYYECERKAYNVRIEAPGYPSIELVADCSEADVVFDDIFVSA